MNAALARFSLALGLLYGAASTPAQLAVKGRLLLADDFKSLPAYTKEYQPLADGWRVKATHPAWTPTPEGIASSWAQGHNPVLFYEGNFQDVVVEVEFRFRREPGKAAYLRVGPANRDLDPRGYTVSAWANVDSLARLPGVVLEHEEWRTQGYTGVATQIAEFKPDTWYAMRVEVVGDRALVSCNGVTVSGRYPKFELPKNFLMLGVGHSPHELRRLRVYAAKANPGWADPGPPPPTPLAAVPPRPALQAATVQKLARMTPLFDGQTLDGWIQSPASPTGIDRREVIDVAGFARRILARSDPVAAFIHDQLDAPARAGLAAALAGKADPRQTLGPVMKSLNALLQGGGSLFDEARFRSVALRARTRTLLDQMPAGAALARLNRLLLEDAFARELVQIPDTGWVARDGMLASTGAGRGVIYTVRDYENYRLVFQVRQESGPQFDHYPGILLFCQRPPAGEPGLDALGGIQFAVPSAGHWDYRPGINRSGEHFRRPLRLRYDAGEWAQVEVLVNGKTGTARMAIAQPAGTRAIEVLGFNDPAAARRGPIALQMHNARLFDEYKDLRIEVDPAEPDKLILLD